MEWKTKMQPKRNLEADALLKIRDRALELQSQLKGAWVQTEVTQCWVQAVLEQLASGAPLTMRAKLEAAYAAHPTELVDALNVVSDLVKKPSFLFTDDDVERTLFVYEANIGTKEYKGE